MRSMIQPLVAKHFVTCWWVGHHPSRRSPRKWLTPKVETQRRMALLRNVTSLFLKQSTDRDEALRAAEDLLLTHSHVQRGDMIVLTIGEPMGKSGGTNTMKIVRVGDHRA